MKNFILLIFIAIPFLIFSQGVSNNGAKIYIAEGAFIHAGDFTTTSSNTNGVIDLNGTLDIEGDWINNSDTKNIFKNIEELPNGWLIMQSSEDSEISGLTETVFENLQIKNGKKILKTNNNIIKGILEVDAVLELNNNLLKIENNSVNAIKFTSGYILSETLPDDGLGQIEWNIGLQTGIYNIPFGSGDGGNNLNISYTPITEGLPTTGTVTFATYKVNNYNEPIPSNTNAFETLKPESIVDRFWQIESNYSTKPDFKVELSYTNRDIDQNNNSELDIQELKLFRYNPNKSSWIDTAFVTTSSQSNKIEANIDSDNFYSWWIIANSEIVTETNIPNGFTPNGDGFNDNWVIENLQENTEIIIYNRWGDKVFESKNYENNWDGGKNPSGAYYYILKFSDKTIKNKSGVINILR